MDYCFGCVQGCSCCKSRIELGISLVFLHLIELLLYLYAFYSIFDKIKDNKRFELRDDVPWYLIFISQMITTSIILLFLIITICKGRVKSTSRNLSKNCMKLIIVNLVLWVFNFLYYILINTFTTVGLLKLFALEILPVFAFLFWRITIWNHYKKELNSHSNPLINT